MRRLRTRAGRKKESRATRSDRPSRTKRRRRAPRIGAPVLRRGAPRHRARVAIARPRHRARIRNSARRARVYLTCPRPMRRPSANGEPRSTTRTAARVQAPNDLSGRGAKRCARTSQSPERRRPKSASSTYPTRREGAGPMRASSGAESSSAWPRATRPNAMQTTKPVASRPRVPHTRLGASPRAPTTAVRDVRTPSPGLVPNGMRAPLARRRHGTSIPEVRPIASHLPTPFPPTRIVAPTTPRSRRSSRAGRTINTRRGTTPSSPGARSRNAHGRSPSRLGRSSPSTHMTTRPTCRRPLASCLLRSAGPRPAERVRSRNRRPDLRRRSAPARTHRPSRRVLPTPAPPAARTRSKVRGSTPRSLDAPMVNEPRSPRSPRASNHDAAIPPRSRKSSPGCVVRRPNAPSPHSNPRPRRRRRVRFASSESSCARAERRRPHRDQRDSSVCSSGARPRARSDGDE